MSNSPYEKLLRFLEANPNSLYVIDNTTLHKSHVCDKWTRVGRDSPAKWIQFSMSAAKYVSGMWPLSINADYIRSVKTLADGSLVLKCYSSPVKHYTYTFKIKAIQFA